MNAADEVLVVTATLGNSCEVWKDIPGYEGLYQVSDQGRVKSFPRKGSRNRNLKQILSKRGGYVVSLCKGGIPVVRYVHQLVLEAFVGPRPKGMDCRHFPDRNTANNRLSNLSWGTRQENMDDKKVHGTLLFGAKHPSSKLTENQVVRIRLLYSKDPKKYNQCELSRMFGVTRSGIEQIVHRVTWKHI